MQGDTDSKRIAVLGVAPDGWREVLADRLSKAGWTVVPTSGDHDPSSSPDAVVLLELDPGAVAGRSFADTDEAAWDALAEAPARRTLVVLQRARAAMGPAGLQFVLMQPATALEGSEQLVAATTGWEAQRVLLKSAARRWGTAGFRANVVLVRPDALVAAPDGRVPADALRTPPALDRSACGIDAVIDTVLLLLRPEGAALTGATLAVDGGALMQP